MRIGMVLAKPFPPDIRVDKEAKALVTAGFEVGVLVESAVGGSNHHETTAYGLEIYRAVVPSLSVWERSIKGLTLLEKHWIKPLQQFIADFEPAVLHVHDFPFVKTVLRMAGPLGLPVVADLHENMPAAYRVYRTRLDPIRWTKDAIVRNYYLWRWYEKRLLPRCARVIVVVPEAAERLYDYGLDPVQIVVVSNTEDETTLSLERPDPEILQRYQNQWVVSYIGGIGPHRGVDTAIRAVPIATRQIPNLRLLVVGAKSGRYLDFVVRLVRQLRVEQVVEILGWQPFEKVSSYVAASAVCLVPHNASEHTQTTIPHKLFQYMIAGKPVVVSDVRPLNRVVEQTRSGLVFKADDPASLAQALVKLYNLPDLGKQLGHNGQQAATGPYAWRHDAQRLIELYRNMGEEIRGT